jgi:hypothetical protein
MAMVVVDVGYARLSSSVDASCHALELHQDDQAWGHKIPKAMDRVMTRTNLRHSSPILSSVGDTKMLINDHINFALISAIYRRLSVGLHNTPRCRFFSAQPVGHLHVVTHKVVAVIYMYNLCSCSVSMYDGGSTYLCTLFKGTDNRQHTINRTALIPVAGGGEGGRQRYVGTWKRRFKQQRMCGCSVAPRLLCNHNFSWCSLVCRRFPVPAEMS